MIKKLLVFVLIASVFAVPVYAQATREASLPIMRRVGQTNFQNIGILGGPGNAPGYIMLNRTSGPPDGSGTYSIDTSVDYTTEVFYLWVGSDGHLRIASPDALATKDGLEFASPPTVFWHDGSGPKVGIH